MMTSLWLISLMSLLVVDMRTGALQQKEPVTNRCYFCARNETSCEAPDSVQCPADRPLCATSAEAPNFTSFLNCAAAALQAPCSMTQTSAKSFALTCVCMENLCNAPFSTETQKQLLNFTSSKFTNNSADYAEVFFEFANITGDNVYKTLTVPVLQAKNQMNNSLLSTAASSTISVHPTVAHPVEIVLPRAEALKQDASEPSDDDEDENEGSGAYEETRSQRQPASAPANPSSYLPAEKNNSPQRFTNHLFLLVATPVLLYFIA